MANEPMKQNGWKLKTTEKYDSKLKWFCKKHPNEARAVLERLEAYFKTLNECNEPQQVTGAWIHPEPHGVKAITEKGKGGALKATRLYMFPHKKELILLLPTIGDKNSQKEDIKYCSDIVQKLIADEIKPKV